MNGGCHAVGPRPLAPRYERFGVIRQFKIETDAEYFAIYGQTWGQYEAGGTLWPVEYGAELTLPDEPWVRAMHEKTAEHPVFWESHLEKYLTPDQRERTYDILKKVVDKAMWKHWNPTFPIEWELANIG